MSKWFKHADWQPLPQVVSRSLPVCPLCKTRTKWDIYDKFGLTTRGYKITCRSCGAEWEYIISKFSAKDVLLGPVPMALYRFVHITQDNSIWILRKTGNNQGFESLLGKEISFSTWRQMIGLFCPNCGEPLAKDEKYCPKCGCKVV